jgi:uncharacterized membrane protein YphA (DoxX/SURF4 family)
MMLFNLISNLRQRKQIQLSIVLTRLITGFSFVPSGIKKILGRPFTTLSAETPIGHFFDALYKTGIYYQFLGWMQLITAILLMSQRFATLGAILFLAIIINIWLITIALHFNGTWVISSMLVLANVMLLLWDAHKLSPIFDHQKRNLGLEPTNIGHDKIWEFLGPILIILSITGALLFEFDLTTPLLKSTWLISISGFIIYGIVVTFRKKDG